MSEDLMRAMQSDLRHNLAFIGSACNLFLHPAEATLLEPARRWSQRERIPYTAGNAESVRYYAGAIDQIARRVRSAQYARI